MWNPRELNNKNNNLTDINQPVLEDISNVITLFDIPGHPFPAAKWLIYFYGKIIIL